MSGEGGDQGPGVLPHGGHRGWFGPCLRKGDLQCEGCVCACNLFFGYRARTRRCWTAGLVLAGQSLAKRTR